MIGSLSNRFYRRSVSFVHALQVRMRSIIAIWVAFAAFACGLRIAFPATPLIGGLSAMFNALPYIAVIGAPLGALWLGLRLFHPQGLHAQPEIRLARIGRWRTLDSLSAREMPEFGPYGLMASLLLGILLNVPVRTLEFLVAIPALGGLAPDWFASLYVVMLADVVVMSSLYMFAFAMALRTVPLFPRFLLLVWGLDLVAQLGIAGMVATIPNVPRTVGIALSHMLEGNVKKVLISAAIWLPYLLLSDRVNLTFRNRIGA